jgi:MoaA/NifB/PqqE/SkfB family radical SAM enzyme
MDNYLVFNKDKLKNLIEKILEEKPDLQWVSLIVTLITIIIFIYKINIKSYFDISILTAFIILYIVLAFYTVFSLKKWYEYNKKYKDKKNIFKELENNTIEKDFTYIFIIKKIINGESKILVEKNKMNGYWLLYITGHQSIKEKKEIKKVFKEKYNFNFNFEIEELKYQDLNNILKQKPKFEYALINYKFYFVNIKLNFNDFDSKIKGLYKFVSLNEMKDDILTVKSNYDLIIHLEEKIKLELLDESFKSGFFDKKLDNIKVIWNITKKCGYTCSFCATDSYNKDIKELLFEDRIKIAEELNKINNLSLDIAGGDPLFYQDDRKVIQHISKYIIKENLTLTTTGNSISNFCKGNYNKLTEITNEVDISFDYPAGWEENFRGKKYNQDNYNIAKKLIENGIKVNILVTLSQHNIENMEIIEKLIEEIEELNPHSVTLLRLMPVGRLNYKKYPKNYDPSLAINLFKQSNINSKLKLHCAFRSHISNENKNYCNMLIEKLGVDNKGNLYTCAWAGYLDVSKEENPFYLGNLLEQTLEDIVNSEKSYKLFKKLKNKNIHYCPIFSYLKSNNSKDFLEKNYDNLIVN